MHNVVKAAKDDGIPDDATSDQGAVFLGGLDGKGVNALEMASAFATFAADGVYAQPYSIARITDRDGKVIYQHKAQRTQVFTADQVGVINRPLQRVVQEGTGVAAKIGRPVAGKTGTTQDNKDAWFIGYTPDLATGVWVGYPQPKPMSDVHGRSVTGGSFPAQIFSDVMRAAEKGMKVRALKTFDPSELDLHKASKASRSSEPSDETTTTLEIVPEVPSTLLQPRNDREEDATTTTTERPRRTTTTSEPRPTTSTTEKQQAKQEPAATEQQSTTPSTAVTQAEPASP